MGNNKKSTQTPQDGSASLPTPLTATKSGDTLTGDTAVHNDTPHSTPGTTTETIVEDTNEPDMPKFPASNASPNVLAVAQTIHSMQTTLRSMVQTFDILASETEKVATQGPLIKANDQLLALNNDLENQIRHQESEIQKMREYIELRIQDAIANSLRARAFEKIEKRIEEEVEKRVRQNLEALVPKELRAQSEAHVGTVRSIQLELYNREARRHNATLTPTSKSGLRPLWKHLEGAGSGALTFADYPPKFPVNLKALFYLKSSDARALLKDYNIDGGNTKGSREDDVNRFMTFIGVPYRVHSFASYPLSSAGAHRLNTPLVTSRRACM